MQKKSQEESLKFKSKKAKKAEAFFFYHKQIRIMYLSLYTKQKRGYCISSILAFY